MTSCYTVVISNDDIHVKWWVAMIWRAVSPEDVKKHDFVIWTEGFTVCRFLYEHVISQSDFSPLKHVNILINLMDLD